MTQMGPIALWWPQLLLLLLASTSWTTALLPVPPVEQVTKTVADDPIEDATVGPAEAGAEFRLPLNVRPEHYKLEVITHLNDDNDGFRFAGSVWIKIICDQETDRITLHSRHLTINESAVTIVTIDSTPESAASNESSSRSPRSDTIAVKGIQFDERRDFLHVDVSGGPLRQGVAYMLHFQFEAPLEKGLSGYYLSSYFDKAAQRNLYLSVTQFEAIYARMAFPCFDEPAFKAKFEIILGHADKYHALSNMPVKRSEPFKNRPGWTWDFFETSVPMSTYLVAYSVNDFEYRESTAKLSSDVTFRIWARRDAIDQVDYARTFGPQVLRFYENYFDVPFPLPKMDMMAVPDFSAGAMENWGLVTYRETLLLYSPDTSSASNQHSVASVIAHELAHQWFGNLVTMRWWDDLWLNEGFATYVASLGVHHLHPEWNSFEEESLTNTLSIFSFDALRSSHSVKVPIPDPSTIFQIFDAISYKKGSSIIRMMHRFLGEKSFQGGVHAYLKKHSYGNAEQDNLWDALTAEAHRQHTLPTAITVKQIMDKWTLQTGYPKVTVDRNYATNEAVLTQRRYLARTLVARSAADEQCWWVPLSYTTAAERNFNDTSAKDWLECAKDAVESQPKQIGGMPGAKEWVLFNIDMSGLYKVQYDAQNWQLLIDQLNGGDHKAIGTVNRAQLIDDAMELAWTGELNYTVALPLLRYLNAEEEYIPWVAALSNLERVNRQLKRTPQYGAFKEYIKQIIAPIYGKLGGLNAGRQNGDAEDVIKHKVQIASWACRFGVGDCVEKSVEWFRQWMLTEDPDATNAIPIDLRKTVYCTALRTGGEVEWNFLWSRYKHTNVASVRELILRSLGCSREVWLLNRYLDMSLNDTTGIRKQDASLLFSLVSSSEVGFFVARAFFEHNVDKLYNIFKPDSSRLSRYVTALASQMNTAADTEFLKEFTANRTEIFEKSTKGIEQGLETIETNRLWHEFNYAEIGRYLKAVEK